MKRRNQITTLACCVVLLPNIAPADSCDPSRNCYTDTTIYISPMDDDEIFRPPRECPSVEIMNILGEETRKTAERMGLSYFNKGNYAMAAYWFHGASMGYAVHCNLKGFMVTLRNMRLSYCKIYLRKRALDKERLRDALMNCSRFKGVDLEALIQKARASP